MSLTLYDFFSIVNRDISPILLSGRNFSEIQSMAEKFPENLTSVTGVECHLGQGKPHADWGLEILGNETARGVLERFLIDEDDAQSLFQGRMWHNIREFSASWNDPGSALCKNIRAAWFEFDSTDRIQVIPAPCVFLVPAFTSGEEVGASIEWIFDNAIPVLTGADCPVDIKDTFMRCIRKLPADSSIFIIGIMLPRKSRKIRLSVKFDDPLKIIPYLADIGWPYETAHLCLLIHDAIRTKVNRIILDLDIGGEVGPKLGLECSFCPTIYHREHKWRDLFHYLVDSELISRAECDAVLSFPGSDIIIRHSGNGTSSLNDKTPERERIISSTIIRYISHLKFVYSPSEPLAVKAYIGIRQIDTGKDSIVETFSDSEAVNELNKKKSTA